jgi:hypothetical protein
MGVQRIGAPFAMQQRKQDDDREHRERHERHERCGRKVPGMRPFPGLCLSSAPPEDALGPGSRTARKRSNHGIENR